MGYRSALLLRWSRRDRLAVVVVAVAVAFLVGATLLGVATGTQARGLAADYAADGEVAHYPSVDAARAAAGPDRAVLPAATITVEGYERTVVGVPDPPPSIRVVDEVRTFPEGRAGVLESQTGPVGTITIRTAEGSREFRAQTRPGSPFLAEDWFVTAPETVTSIGADGAFVVATDVSLVDGTGGSTLPGGSPIVSALAFFVYGSRQLVELLALATVAGGVLVAVTTFSVTSIAVEERRDTIATVRATGGTPGQVYALFAGRAALLTAAGVALGYALGVILIRLVVNAAVFLGLPISLAVAPSGRAVELLVPTTGVLVVVGTLAGAVATRPAVAAAPAAVRHRAASSGGGSAAASAPASTRADGGQRGRGGRSPGVGARLRAALSPTVLDRDVLVPSTATLTVFVAFALLLSAGGTVLGPLASTGEQTITQPNAPHPIASNVPQSYAPVLRQQGVAASPEILAFEAVGGEPFVARGVNYSAYATLSDATIVRGRPPRTDAEAVVGADLAAAIGVGVGDAVALGGSTTSAITRVRVVGVFAGTGLQDDQLLVSLPTARHLAGRGRDNVHFIRVSDLPDPAAGDSPIVVLDAGVTANRTAVRVRIVARNYGLGEATRTVTVALGDRTRSVDLTLDRGRRTAETVAFPRPPDGTYTLTAGDVTREVSIGEGATTGTDADATADGLRVVVPGNAPTGSRVRVSVTDGGVPLKNATVSVRDRTWRTAGDGTVRVRFDRSGPVDVRATDPATGRTTEQLVWVRDDARRRLHAEPAVEPAHPTVVTRPVATVRLTNPWATNVTREVTVRGPNTTARRTVTLAPDAATSLRVRLPPRPGGTYEVGVTQLNATPTTVEYTVRGDERLAAALATSGRSARGGGLTQAVSVVFGNLQVLVAGLVVLTGAMTVGATTASFVRSVRARRREIGIRRAVGATPASIARVVLGDALKLGTVSAVLAVAIATGAVGGLLALGHLRLFGIALQPTFGPGLLIGTAGVALGLTLLSAGLATWATLRASPADLLADRGASATRRSWNLDRDATGGVDRDANRNPDGGVDGD